MLYCDILKKGITMTKEMFNHLYRVLIVTTDFDNKKEKELVFKIVKELEKLERELT